MSKVNRYSFGFAFLWCLIGPKNLKPLSQPIDSKLRPIVARSPAFSCASSSFLAFASLSCLIAPENPLSQPIRFKTRTSRNSVTRVFPPLSQPIDSKLRPIVARSPAFSCASSSFLAFASLSCLIAPENPLSQPIRFKTRTSRNSVTRVFPRFRQWAYLCLTLKS